MKCVACSLPVVDGSHIFCGICRLDALVATGRPASLLVECSYCHVGDLTPDPDEEPVCRECERELERDACRRGLRVDMPRVKDGLGVSGLIGKFFGGVRHE